MLAHRILFRAAVAVAVLGVVMIPAPGPGFLVLSLVPPMVLIALILRVRP